jgi:hypothetical protein
MSWSKKEEERDWRDSGRERREGDEGRGLSSRGKSSRGKAFLVGVGSLRPATAVVAIEEEY